MNTNFNDYPDILTAEQLAEILQMSTTHVYNLANKGDLPCRKFGRCIRFSKKEIMELVLGNEEN